MTIIKSFKDYDDDDPEIDRRKNRWNYWNALKKIRVEYLDGKTNFDAYEFEEYIITVYGIKMHLTDGKITDGYEIVDEKKYVVFLLKFT
jgi:hypothetical protein